MASHALVKTCLKLAFSLALFVPMPGVQASPSQMGAGQHTVYRTAFEADVDSLDPLQIGNALSFEVSHNLYSGLLRYRSGMIGPNQTYGDLLPDLASSWEVSQDGKTYTFHLRKDVQFHNGRPFEAQDVKYSLERLANPQNSSRGLWAIEGLGLEGLQAFQEASRKGKMAFLKGVEVHDKFTVSITLANALPYALHFLAMPYFAIVPHEEIEKWGNHFSEHAVGTGPYQLKEWKVGQRIVLVKNEHYFEKGLPHIPSLSYEIIADPKLRLQKFEKGELEELKPPIPAADLERILANPHFNPIGSAALHKLERINDAKQTPVIKDREWVVQYLGMNTSSEPFQDKRVRQAFNYAIDKQQMIQQVRAGNAEPVHGVLPAGFPGYKPDRPVPYPFDLKKAKELMAQAGWIDRNHDGLLDKNGKPFKLTFWHNESPVYAMMGAIVKANLRALGIDIDVRAVDWTVYFDKVRGTKDIQGKIMPAEGKLFRFGWAADFPDPDNFLWNLFSSDNLG